MTTVPFMPIVEIITRIALTATASAPFLSPRPTHRPAAIAAASVTRTNSSARLRSGDSGAGDRLSVMLGLYRALRAVDRDLTGLDREDDGSAGCEIELGRGEDRDV